MTRRGAVTPDVLTVGGLQSTHFPTVTEASVLIVGTPVEGGLISLAQISLAQLAKVLAPYLNLADVAPLPAYQLVQIWRAKKNVNGDPLPALPAYLPVQIWRAKANVQMVRPNAPSGLVVELVGGAYRLRFTDNATNEASFRVARKTGSGSFEPYLTLAMDQTVTGNLTDIQPDTLYTFQVLATNAAGDSPWSNPATLRVDTPATPRPPQPPTLPPITVRADVEELALVLPAFTDPQGQALTYALTGLPDGLSFAPATRRLTGYAHAAGTLELTYSATNASGLTGSAKQELVISVPALTQVRGQLRSTGGYSWVQETEITLTQPGRVLHRLSTSRVRSSELVLLGELLTDRVLIAANYAFRDSQNRTGTPAHPETGSGVYYLHLMVERDPASYRVYGFALDNYYAWSVASGSLPDAPPAEQ